MGLGFLHLAGAGDGMKLRDLSHPSWRSALSSQPLVAKLSLGLGHMESLQTPRFGSLLLPHVRTTGWARAALSRMKRPSPSGAGTWGSRAWSSFEQKSELSLCSLSLTWEELLPYNLSVALTDRSEKPQGKVEDSVAPADRTPHFPSSVFCPSTHPAQGGLSIVSQISSSPHLTSGPGSQTWS